MNRKAVSVIVALALVVSVNVTTVKASPSKSGQGTNITEVQDKTKELESKIEVMDSKIESIIYKIEDNKKDIEKNKKDVEKLQKDIEKTQKDIDARKDVFNKRVRAMYISGVDSYADILLESKGVGDFIERLDTVKKIIGFDQGVISELNDKKQQVQNKKVSLNKKNSEIASLKVENEKKLSQIKNEKSTQQVALNKLNAEKKEYEAKQKEAEKKQAEEMKSVQAKQSNTKSTSSNSGSSTNYSRGGGTTVVPPSSANTGDVVSYAMKFLGTPYVWGGTSPSGFDCSGFVQYVYSHCGVGLPRTSESQMGQGNSVPRDQLQPGDLVFFRSGGHVGIYVGGGSYIHAPHTGDVVKISSLSGSSSYCGARRVR